MAKSKKEISKRDGDSVKIIDVKLDSTSMDLVLKEVDKRLKTGKKTFITTPNPEFVVFAQAHPWFKSILNQADIAIPDGIGLVWASRLLTLRSPAEILVSASDSLAKRRTLLDKLFVARKVKPRKIWRAPLANCKKVTSRPAVRERISGTDLMEKLCQEAAKRGWGVYFLGGRPGVAKKALAVLKKRYPGLKGWADSGPVVEIDSNGKLAVKTPRMVARLSLDSSEVEEKKKTKDTLVSVLSTSEGSKLRPGVGGRSVSGGHHSSEVEYWIREINQKHPDLLFVAFGMGKQEKFIWDNWEQLKVKLAMGVGGAFDYIAGEVPRAPAWMRNLGLEWLYRLIRQPFRWRRQLALIRFIYLILREKTILTAERVKGNY